MRTLIKLILAFCTLWCTWDSQAQTERSLHAIHQYRDDRIRLRWAPTNPEYWALCRQYGFVLERYVLDSNRTLQRSKAQLALDPIRPADTSFWKNRLDDPNPFWALLAQSIFSASVSLTLQSGLKAQQWQDVYEERQQRFALGLLACDVDFEIAKAAGLAWEDPYIRKGETYLYRLYDLIPDSIFNGDTIQINVSTQQHLQAPKILDFKVKAQSNRAVLTWSKKHLESIYVAYEIERSPDGRRFEKRNPYPKIALSDPLQNSLMLLDSLETLRPYHYRIRAYDVFGLAGPWSDIAKLEFETAISSYAHSLRWNENQASLSFDLDSAVEAEVETLFVIRKTALEAPADTLLKNISSHKRQVSLRLPTAETHYIQVGIRYKQGTQTLSNPLMIQTVDSLAPPIPTLWYAVQDSQFLVHIHWKALKTPDLAGYRLFRSVDQQDWEPLCASMIMDTSYIDSLSAHNRQPWVYALLSEDHRGNRSELSKPKPIQLFDKPLHQHIKLLKESPSKKGRWIHWANPYPELQGRLLLVNSKGDTLTRYRWPIGLIRDSLHIDAKFLVPGQALYLQLHASDGRYSPLSEAIRMPKAVVVHKPLLTLVPDRRRRQIVLQWSDQHRKGIIRVYRRHAEQGWTLIQTLDASEGLTVDRDLELHQKYAYRIEHMDERRCFSEEHSLLF